MAKGSSVPAWPALHAALAPDRGDDVVRGDPGRLVDRAARAPASAGHGSGVELRGDLGAEELDQLLELEVGGEAGGALVAAAAVLAGDRRDVDRRRRWSAG